MPYSNMKRSSVPLVTIFNGTPLLEASPLTMQILNCFRSQVSHTLPKADSILSGVNQMAWTFDAPGGLSDFSDPSKWHEVMRREANQILLILVATALGKKVEQLSDADIETVAPQLSYVHPLVEEVPANAETIAVEAWGGFPRLVDRQAPWQLPPHPQDLDGRYRAVEDLGEEDWGEGRFIDVHGHVLQLPVRHRQDEYLEWAVRRDPAGKLTKISFVAEGYDYYAELFKEDEAKVVDLFKLYTERNDITADDLRAPNDIYWQYDGGRDLAIEAGAFNPRNRINIDPGIVHLSHRANSLGAEINLAGVSALARKKADGSLLSGSSAEELLCCNRGGEPNRNSDPKISQQAYNLVRQGYRYTLANPIGLYIAGIEEDNITLPDGEKLPREWWTVVRGRDLWTDDNSRTLRLELAPPAGESIGLEDLKVGGTPLRHPGQVARQVNVHLFVSRWKRAVEGVGPVVACRGTCCRLKGTEILFITGKGVCTGEYELAFPGLLPTNKLASQSLNVRQNSR